MGGKRKVDLKKRGIGIIVLVMFVLVAASSIPIAQAIPHTIEMRVEGTSGLSFSGTYGDLGFQSW